MRIRQSSGFSRVLCGWIIVLVALSGCEKGSSTPSQPPATQGALPDIGGIWLPDASRAGAWPAKLPLTAAARSIMDHFNPSVSDPTTFCMPLGTPRNMLQTEYPLEIVQTARLVLLVLQPNLSNTEVRRIPLDGSSLPESPEASWYGTSPGRWEGSTLVVETIGLRPDALISGNGLAHSEQLRVIERLSVVKGAGQEKVLLDEIELQDPKAYQEPLKTRRLFVRAPQAHLREGSCVELRWIDKLWRDRLHEHAEARRKAGKSR
jgi:hypothetical protein